MSLVEICVHGFPHLGVILQCVFKVVLNFPSSLSRILFYVTWPLLLTFRLRLHGAHFHIGAETFWASVLEL